MTILISDVTYDKSNIFMHTYMHTRVQKYWVIWSHLWCITLHIFIGKTALSKFYRVTDGTFKRPRYGRISNSLSIHPSHCVFFSDAQNRISFFLSLFFLSSFFYAQRCPWKGTRTKRSLGFFSMAPRFSPRHNTQNILFCWRNNQTTLDELSVVWMIV